MKRKKKSGRVCVYCETKRKRKLNSDNWFMLGIERPYKNIWFHKECYKKVESNLEDFLVDTYNYWIKL